jgi:hypothetical protein
MKYVRLIAQVLLGLSLCAFGAMGLLIVMPDPHAFWVKQEGFAPESEALILTMWDTGFLMHSVAVTHLVAGLMILFNRFVPLALVIHLPVSIQMTLFHLFLDPGTGMIAYLVLVLNLLLMIAHRAAYRGLLVARTDQTVDDSDWQKTVDSL